MVNFMYVCIFSELNLLRTKNSETTVVDYFDDFINLQHNQTGTLRYHILLELSAELW